MLLYFILNLKERNLYFLGFKANDCLVGSLLEFKVLLHDDDYTERFIQLKLLVIVTETTILAE